MKTNISQGDIKDARPSDEEGQPACDFAGFYQSDWVILQKMFAIKGAKQELDDESA